MNIKIHTQQIRSIDFFLKQHNALKCTNGAFRALSDGKSQDDDDDDDDDDPNLKSLGNYKSLFKITLLARLIYYYYNCGRYYY